jgi:methionyl aminopeptidase
MIFIKNEPELGLMRRNGEILRDCFRRIEEEIRPGVITGELDRIAEEFIRANDAVPAFKGYHGYPAAICASVNEEVVHGIPGSRVLVEGDIVGVDMGVLRDGFYADASRTFAVGDVSDGARRLMKVTWEALELGIDKARAGNHLTDISCVIQQHAESNGYQVVRALVGHGIGRMMHEEPQIPNFGPAGQGPVLKRGMTLAIEPMVNAGTYEVVTLKDNWTYVTVDGKISCHYEDTIAVTDNGPIILTR